MTPPDCSAERIHALHAWYEANVMRMRITPEVERLWLLWLKAGYNGPDLKRVVVYLKRQINSGKRKDGSLALVNLLGIDEHGVHRFATDLGLASANYRVDSKLSALPDSEVAGNPQPARRRDVAEALTPRPGAALTHEQLQARITELETLKRTITTDAIES